MKFKLEKLHLKNEYFLVLLPLFFICHGYNENYAVVNIRDVIVLLLKYLALLAIFFSFTLWLFKNWRKAAVVTLFIASFYFFFGPIHDAAKYLLGKNLFTSYSFILPLSLLLFALLIVTIKRTDRSFNQFTRYCNSVLILLILMEIAFLFKNNSFSKENEKKYSFANACDTCLRPDIYLIISDGYAGARELQDILNFNNSAFENALRHRGFRIIIDSKSNYNLTPYSVASLFEANYFSTLKDKENKKDVDHCLNTINNNFVLSFFRNQHYKFFNHSIFRFNDQAPLINSMFFVIGQDAINSQTLWGRMNRDIRFNLVTRWKWKPEMKRWTKKNVREIEEVIDQTLITSAQKDDMPRFVYTHVMMPHYPYCLDRKGNFNDPSVIFEENWSRKKDYVEYLQYSNTRFLKMIDQILSTSPKPPVIIFMSDHGFREFEMTEETIKYGFININAVYLPNQRYDGFYNEMSNVNQFRVLINTLFNQQLPLLKDSSSFIK